MADLRSGALVRLASPVLVVASIVLPVACVAGALTYSGRFGRQTLWLYMAPLLLLAPLWVRMRLLGLERATLTTRMLDLAVLVVSVARATGPVVPVSGHMLFLTYSLLTTPAWWYRWAALLLIIVTTAFKFGALWDPLSWFLGLVLGVIAALSHRWLAGRVADGRVVPEADA